MSENVRTYGKRIYAINKRRICTVAYSCYGVFELPYQTIFFIPSHILRAMMGLFIV